MKVWYKRGVVGRYLKFYREDFRCFTFSIHGNKRVKPERVYRSRNRRIYSIEIVPDFPIDAKLILE